MESHAYENPAIGDAMVTSRRWVPAAAATVYDTLIDADRYPEWLVGARHVRVTTNWPESGSSFEHEVGAGPFEVHDVTTATGGDPGHTLDLRVRARPMLEADVHFEIRAEDRRSCEVVMVEQPVGRFRVIAPLVAPLIRLRNDRSLERLASLLAPQ
jgi:ribosome-associated toxin RatA of RatAB toxin-antitoxin module